jgi:nucleoside-triphosphatase
MAASPSPHRALLLTGSPGAGKTTVIQKAARKLEGRRVRGFITEELREAGERVGFSIQTFDGRSAVLAHRDIRSPHRISRYGVDVAALDEIVNDALALEPPAEVYLVDEIGKMECMSGCFVACIERILRSGRLLVATVAARGGGLIERVKTRGDVVLWKVTRSNREALPENIVRWIDARRNAS